MTEYKDMKPCESCDGTGWEEDINVSEEIRKIEKDLCDASERPDDLGYQAYIELSGFRKAQKLYIRLMNKAIRDSRK